MDELGFLQELSEEELCELVLMPLFTALGFRDIRYTHGILEHGKDIICSKYDELDGHVYIGFTVKSRPLSGSVSSSRSAREVLYQIKQALSVPFINPFNGREVTLGRVYFVTPFAISQHAILSIKEELREFGSSVRFVDGVKLLDLVREHLPALLSSLPDPRRRYLHTLSQRLLQVRTLASLGALREYTLPEIYTGGTLSLTTPEEASFLSFIDLMAGDRLQPASVFLEHRYVVILADVGAGKTTFLEKLAFDIVSATDNAAPAGLPVLLKLATLPEKSLHADERLFAWIQEQIENVVNGAEGLDPSDVLLLLDGYDEIRTGHHLVEAFLPSLVERFPRGVVVTSRPSRVPLLPHPFGYFRLDPFSESDIHEFLFKWFPESGERANEVYELITGDEHLLRFCRTPLLLTLYVALASAPNVDSLPTRKTDIYEAISELLLGKWDSQRGVTSRFSNAIKGYFLERVAWTAQSHHTKHFMRSSLVTLADSVLNVSKAAQRISASGLVDEIIFRSSLIRYNENRDLEFVHLSFQEFFAAKHIVRMGDVRHVQLNLFDEWWRNVLAFYFGIVRTMDEIRLTEKKAAGNGHILLEFLAEADYTSEQVRYMISLVMARQLLASASLPDSVVDVCRRFPADLLPALRDLLGRASKSEPPEYAYRFLSFVVSLTPLGISVSLEDEQFVAWLRPGQILELLQPVVRSLEDPTWQRFGRKLVLEFDDSLYRELKASPYTPRARLVAELEAARAAIKVILRNNNRIDAPMRHDWSLVLDDMRHHLELLL
jgi:hypothetical protein